MAGEKKGKAYEALVHVALQELIANKKLAGPLHWNVTPKTMSIEPDFMTGVDEDDPKTILLVNHSNAAGNSHMKFWRNLGELVEAKTMLFNMPRVYCLTFGVIKEDLEPVQEHAFDQFVWVRQVTHHWADDLDSFISTCVQSFPKGQDAQTDFMRNALKKASAKAKAAYLLFKSLLEDMHKAKSATLNMMWADHRKRQAPVAPGARNTFFRRGIGKLLLLDDRSAFDKDGKLVKIIKPDVVAFMERLEIGRRVVGGLRITDPEVLWAMRHVAAKDIDIIFKVKENERMAEWIETLRGLSGIEAQLEYIAGHWEALNTTKGMFDLLKLCHLNPHKMCPAAVPDGSRRVWLFHAISEIIKISGGTRTGFGLAYLLGILTDLQGVERHRSEVEKAIGRKIEWHSAETIRLGLQDWQSANSKQSFSFSDDDLARISYVLAEILKTILKPIPSRDAEALTKAVIQTVLEAKLLTYRDFNPIGLIVSAALKKAVGKMPTSKLIQACFAEATISGGTKIDPRSSGTNVLISGNTIINWQSAHGSHTNDKKKELCGRAIGLRYHWSGAAFVHRNGIQKLILVLDGTWKQADLNALLRSGWDEIFYPDEMDQLARAIV